MRALTPVHRLLMVVVIAAAFGGPLAPVAHAGPAAPAVPSAIAVPDGHRLFLVGHAVGVQIYSCEVTPTGPGWSFVAPRAALYAGNGKLLATHFGGPTWQARDGSRVIAQRVAGITVDETAIPWLLLSTTSTAAGPDGDRLASTAYIQRVATSGGLAPPATTCDAASIGSVVEVPYTSDYYFWR